MNAEQGFLNAILADPVGDTDRLVYADWLDERGDTDAAAFLRAECDALRLKEVGEASPRYRALRQIMAVLAAKIEGDWLKRMARVTLTLVSYPAEHKITTIHVIRSMTGLFLSECKLISEQLPFPLMRFHLWEHAETVQRSFGEYGAETRVELSSAGRIYNFREGSRAAP